MGFFTPHRANAPGTTTTDTIPPIDVDSFDRRDLSWRLMRHYDSRPEGINVHILSDNSVVEGEGPWDITPPNPTVVRTFHGGRLGRYEVDAAEEAILEAAGYTVADV